MSDTKSASQEWLHDFREGIVCLPFNRVIDFDDLYVLGCRPRFGRPFYFSYRVIGGEFYSRFLGSYLWYPHVVVIGPIQFGFRFAHAPMGEPNDPVDS